MVLVKPPATTCGIAPRTTEVGTDCMRIFHPGGMLSRRRCLLYLALFTFQANMFQVGPVWVGLLEKLATLPLSVAMVGRK